MKNLILHIEQIKDKDLFLEFEEELEVFPVIAEMIENRECEFLGPLKIKVKAFKIRDFYEVVGNFQTRIRVTCSRCLKDFDTSMKSDFELTYTKELPGLPEISDEEEVQLKVEEIGLMYFRGEEIDLQQGIQEQVLMALPLQPLCEKNCKGLCAKCGADLNQGACGCQAEPISNKFAILKNLKLNNK